MIAIDRVPQYLVCFQSVPIEKVSRKVIAVCQLGPLFIRSLATNCCYWSWPRRGPSGDPVCWS